MSDLALELEKIIKLNLELYQNKLNALHCAKKDHKREKALRKYCLKFNRLQCFFRPVNEDGLECFRVSVAVLDEYKALYEKLLKIQ
jgi:hypothetical protein